MRHVEKEMNPINARNTLTAIGSQGGLCYAIMAGLSGSVLLSQPQSTQNDKTTPTKAKTNITDATNNETICSKYKFLQYDSNGKIDVKQTGSRFLKRAYIPMLLVALYCNLQGLMASMMVVSHINGLPLSLVTSFISRHPLMMHAILGWCMVPAVGAMSFAVVCNVHMSYDENFENGLTFIALSLFTLFGFLVTFQTARMLYGHYSLRYLSNSKNIGTYYTRNLNLDKTKRVRMTQKKKRLEKRM